MEVLTKLPGLTKLQGSMTRSGHLKVVFLYGPFVLSNNIKYLYLYKVICYDHTILS